MRVRACESSLEESLRLFRAYLTARLSPGATIESLIPLFPTSQQQLLKERFIEGKSDKGKSVAHYDLTCLGDTFRARLEELAGRALGCWCTHGDQCHAGVLAEVVNSGATAAQPAQSRGSHRGKRGADALEGDSAGGGGGSTAAKAKAIINFYSTKGEHGCFSNFYRAQFMLDGASWKTSEHYFQVRHSQLQPAAWSGFCTSHVSPPRLKSLLAPSTKLMCATRRPQAKQVLLGGHSYPQQSALTLSTR